MKKLMLLVVAILVFGLIPMQAFAFVDSDISISTDKMYVTNFSQGNLNSLKKNFNISKNQINNDGKIKCNNSLSLNLQISEAENGQLTCNSTGQIKINDIVQKFEASGMLYTNISTSGEVIYSGGLSGYINGYGFSDSDKIISLSLNYNSTTKQSYIPITLGSYGNDNKPPIIVEFGEYFGEIKNAINSMLLTMKKESVHAQTNEVNINQFNYAAKSPNVSEYCLATGTGSYNKKTVIYHSYYGSKEAFPSGSFYAKVRTQVNLSNFISAYNATLPAYNPNYPNRVYTSKEHKVTDVWLNFKTNKTNNRITDPKPDNFSSSVTLKYPSFLIPYGSLNYLMSYFNISIPLNGVSHAYDNNYSSLQTKIWAGGGISDVLTTSSNPYTTKSGVSNNFLVQNAMNAGISCTATTNGSAQIYLLDLCGNGTTIPRWIVVSTSSKTSTLKSVK